MNNINKVDPLTGCFLGSEYVLMANGEERRLDQVQIGEHIACAFNGTAPVLGIRRSLVKDNNMFKINDDLITTGEHSFWSAKTQEWLVCDKNDDHRVASPWRLVETPSGVHFWKFPQGSNPRQMMIGDHLQIGDRSVEIKKIEPITLPDTSPTLITLITTSSMIIHGGYVVGGWCGKDFNKPIQNDIDRRLKLLAGEEHP